jgi:prostaglandin-E synthase 1
MDETTAYSKYIHMIITTTNPVFLVYVLACLLLVANLLFLWLYSGVVRTGSGVVMNREDGAALDYPLAEVDPPEVARVLRAHANAQAITYPFLILGLVFVLAGGGLKSAAIIFGIFTVARLWHTIVYLRGKQPWRTVAFSVSYLAVVALLLDVAWLMISVWI